MCIITNLKMFVEELTAQRMMPVKNSADSLSEATENRGPYDEGFVPVEAEDDDDLFDEGFVEMMPCDFSGYCAGTNCPNFFKCKGSTK